MAKETIPSVTKKLGQIMWFRTDVKQNKTF